MSTRWYLRIFFKFLTLGYLLSFGLCFVMYKWYGELEDHILFASSILPFMSAWTIMISWKEVIDKYRSQEHKDYWG